MTSPPDPAPFSRIQVLASMGLTALSLLLIARFWLLFETVGLMAVQWNGRHGLYGIALGVAITAVGGLLHRVWPQYRASTGEYLTLILDPLAWGDLLWVGLLPGLSEEFLFRGVMLPAIGINGTGIFFSGLCFGVLHMGSINQWPYALWATVVGFLLGWSAIASGNLLVPIVAHTVANWLASGVWKWMQGRETKNKE